MELQNDEIILERFLTDHPIDAVRIIENINQDEIVKILALMPDHLAGKIVTYLNISICVDCLQKLDIQKTARIINDLPLKNGVILLRHMPKEFRDSILEFLPHEKRPHLKKALSFPEGTVGAIMAPSALALYKDMLVEEALKYLKKQTETDLYYIYILNREQKLSGVLSLSEIFRAKSSQNLTSIMQNQVVKIVATVHYKSIVNHPGWQKYHILPVVDTNDVFQGVLQFKVLHSLENKSVKNPSSKNLVAASSAMGELYRLGLASLIRTASDIYGESNTKG